MTAQVRTTVVVVTWRGHARIGKCLDALAEQRRPHRTLVVDNASSDGTATLLAHRELEVLRLPVNTGYAGGIAAALERVDTEFIAWLNDDAVPDADWLAELEDALDRRTEAAAAAAVLRAPDGRVQSAGTVLNRDGYGQDLLSVPSLEDSRGGDETVPFGFCGGAALLRTAVLRAVGGVPAGFFCYYEDTDTAWRLRLAGYTITSAPRAVVTHEHGASTGLGSRRFHYWNERNRLFMLARCAPLAVLLAQLAKFALLAVKPGAPETPNFALGLRARVLLAFLAELPALLARRKRIGARAVFTRSRVWHGATEAGADRIGATTRGGSS